MSKRHSFILTFALLVLPILAMAATPPTIVRRAAEAPKSPRAAPEGAIGLPGWSPVPTGFRPGRTQCAGLGQFGFGLLVGSDEAGYWSGETLSPFGSWTPHGDELGGGVLHVMHRLVFDGMQSIERITVVRDDHTVHYSEDDGTTWTASAFPPDFVPSTVTRMFADPNFVNVAYLLAYGHHFGHDNQGWFVARSFTGGATWDEARFELSSNEADLWCSRALPSEQILAVDRENGDVEVLRSTDLADTFTQLYVFAEVYPDGPIGFAAHEANPGEGWLLTGDQLHHYDGTTQGLPTTLPDAPQAHTLCTAVNTADFLMYADATNVHWSNDRGITFTTLETDDWMFDFNDINTQPTNVQCLMPLTFPAEPGRRPTGPDDVAGAVPVERFYISTGSGTYTYSAGQADAEFHTREGLGNEQVHDLEAADGGGSYRFAASYRDIGLIRYDGSGRPLPWSYVVSSFPNDWGTMAANRVDDPSDPLILTQSRFGATLSGSGVFEGVGLTMSASWPAWQALVADPAIAARWYWCDLNVVAVDYDPNGPTLSQSFGGPSAPPGLFTGYGVAPSAPAVHYAHHSIGTGGESMYRSTDAGGTWSAAVPVFVGASDIEHARARILISPTDPDEVWVAANRVLRSVNGSTYSDVTGSLPFECRVYDLAFEVGSSSRVWLATSHGVFRWTGTDWEDMTPAGGPVPDVPVRAVEAVAEQGVMRIGTYGRGIFDYSLPTTTAVDPDRPTPLALAPLTNPLRGRSTLQYTLPRESNVSLDLIDVTGRQVTRLAEGTRSAGTHRVTLDARTLSAGIYFARLTTSEGERTSKLVIAH